MENKDKVQKAIIMGMNQNKELFKKLAELGEQPMILTEEQKKQLLSLHKPDPYDDLMQGAPHIVEEVLDILKIKVKGINDYNSTIEGDPQ